MSLRGYVTFPIVSTNLFAIIVLCAFTMSCCKTGMQLPQTELTFIQHCLVLSTKEDTMINWWGEKKTLWFHKTHIFIWMIIFWIPDCCCICRVSMSDFPQILLSLKQVLLSRISKYEHISWFANTMQRAISGKWSMTEVLAKDPVYGEGEPKAWKLSSVTLLRQYLMDQKVYWPQKDNSSECWQMASQYVDILCLKVLGTVFPKTIYTKSNIKWTVFASLFFFFTFLSFFNFPH